MNLRQGTTATARVSAAWRRWRSRMPSVSSFKLPEGGARPEHRRGRLAGAYGRGHMQADGVWCTSAPLTRYVSGGFTPNWRVTVGSHRRGELGNAGPGSSEPA